MRETERAKEVRKGRVGGREEEAGEKGETE